MNAFNTLLLLAFSITSQAASILELPKQNLREDGGQLLNGTYQVYPKAYVCGSDLIIDRNNQTISQKWVGSEETACESSSVFVYQKVADQTWKTNIASERLSQDFIDHCSSGGCNFNLYDPDHGHILVEVGDIMKSRLVLHALSERSFHNWYEVSFERKGKIVLRYETEKVLFRQKKLE